MQLFLYDKLSRNRQGGIPFAAKSAFLFPHPPQTAPNCRHLFLLGLAYYIVTQLTPLRIPCLFQKVTGLACPGCGISHFCIRLLHLDFLGAARENLAIALLSPLWLAAFLVRVLWNPKWFAKGSKGENLLLWGSVVVLLLFGVVRNLPHMEFLLPSYLQ